jgi:hypothetical protein
MYFYLQSYHFVIPAKAGIHLPSPRFEGTAQVMDPRLRGGDEELEVVLN